MILDGRVLHGKSFAEYLGSREMRALAVKRRFVLPSMGDVVDAEPLVAWVRQGFWVVTCPACAQRPDNELQAVWTTDPDAMLMCCMVCGNAGVGGRLRRVVLPERAPDITAVLSTRPLEARNWVATETIRDLVAENVLHGHPVPLGIDLDAA